MKIGCYVGYVDTPGTTYQNGYDARWNELVGRLGQTPIMALQYVDKDHPRSGWVSDQSWVIDSWTTNTYMQRVIPIVGLPMAITAGTSLSDFNSIASGGWDTTINGIIASWVNAGWTDFYLRPGWEMNGDWYAWGITGANKAAFNSAFQRIANLAHNYSGARIKTLWNPNTGDPNPEHVPFADYYPGDAYVDVIGIDIYGAPITTDTEPTRASASAADFTMGAAMAFARDHNKPFAIVETGAGGTAFMSNLATAVNGTGGRKIDFIGLWNINDEFGNYQFSSNTTLSTAWVNAIASMDPIASAVRGNRFRGRPPSRPRF